MCDGDSPRRSDEEVRREADEQRIKDPQRWRNSIKFIDSTRRVSAQAFQPEKIPAGVGVITAVPEETGHRVVEAIVSDIGCREPGYEVALKASILRVLEGGSKAGDGERKLSAL